MELKATELPGVTQEKIRLLCEKQSSSITLQDDFGLYIPPSATRTQHSHNTFDLTGAVNDFVEGNKTVLLILGESGSGKSFFGQALIKRKSELYRPSDRIPLFISLPSLRKAKSALMSEALGLHGFTAEEINLLCVTQKFLLIFDAYDELNSFDNLYMNNKMEGWDAKIITTCRPSYFGQDSNYKRYFMPFKSQRPMTTAIEELFVAPFVRGQVSQYIVQYLDVKKIELRDEILVREDLSDEWLLPKTYEGWIEKIPGLKDLACQPFLLRITMEVLPDVISELQAMSDSPEKHLMTSAKLYDHFVRQWYTRQENKLIGLGQSVGRAFQKDCMAYAKALGKKMHEKNLSVVYYEDQSSMTDAFADEEDQDQDQEVDAGKAQWALFFSDEMIPQDKGSDDRRQNRIRCRRACPLKKVGENQWAFMHTSLRDYFMTLTIASSQSKVNLVNSNVQLQGSMSPSLSQRPVQAAGHRTVGKFCLMNRFNRQEADELLRNEGIKVIFEQEGGNQKVILGRGAYGKFRVARNLINNRFAGVKKIRGESCIQESEHEADFQRELNGLPNIMPIWDSQTITSKKTAHAVLLQFMPLAGFGNGEKLVDVLRYVENEDLKRRFLIYVLKSMLVGVKGMHSRRMYHLDLKPANVVFDCRGELYIIDFGCAYREYGNKIDALLRDKKGDFRYFSPDRMAELRRRCLRAPAASLEIAEFFDGEKADIWAIGVSLLELLMERLNYIRGADLAIKWQLRNWSNAHFVQCFDSISGWSEASENSLMGCIKALLSIDPKQRPSASEVLKNPLFQDPNSQLSPAELKGLMGDFIRWKTNPPAPLASSQILGYTPGMTESGDEGVGYLLYEAPQSGAYSSVLGDDDPPLASSAKYSIIHSDDDSDSNEIRMKL